MGRARKPRNPLDPVVHYAWRRTKKQSKAQRRIKRATSLNKTARRDATCDTLIVVPQTPNANTCWFNAILMILFFPDKMRNVVKKALATHHSHLAPDVLHRFLSLLLLYKQPIATHRRIYDKAFNRGLRPEEILKAVYKEHPTVFGNLATDAIVGIQGANGAKYLKNMLVLCGVRANSYAVHDGMLFQTNELPFDPKPDIVCIFVGEYGAHTKAVKLHPWSFETAFRIGKMLFVLDATLLGSNNGQIWHAIAGVTCNGKRYYYNGWQQHNIPCPLIPVDFARRGIYLDARNGTCFSEDPRAPSDLYYNGADPRQAQCLVYVRTRQ